MDDRSFRLGDHGRYPAEISPFVSSFANNTRDHGVRFWTTCVVHIHLRAVRDPNWSNAKAGDLGLVSVLGGVHAVVSVAERLFANRRMSGNSAYTPQHPDNRWIVCFTRKKCRPQPVLANRSRTDKHCIRVHSNLFCRPCCNCYTRSCHRIAAKHRKRRITMR